MAPQETFQFDVYGQGERELSTGNIPALYHYGNDGGFTGMLGSKALWFSHIRDQNDTEELTHAIELIYHTIEHNYPGLILPKYISETAPIYTCSMSAAEDLLSQWRGYCHEGGYSYSIDRGQLFRMISSNRLILAKCIYEETEKIDFIKRYIIQMSPETYLRYLNYRSNQYTPSWQTEPTHPIIYGHSMHSKYKNIIRRRIATYAPILKHYAFREEQEWRMVTVPDYRDVPNTGGIIPASTADIFPNPLSPLTRSVGTRVIRYVVMPLVENPSDEVLISTVYISPTQDKETSKRDCQTLMQTHGTVDVRNSEIPYRTW